MALFSNIDINATDTLSTHTFITNQNVIIGALVCNTNSQNITVDITLRGMYLVKDHPIPVESTSSVLEGKIVANEADVLTVIVNETGATADVIFSVLQDAIAAV